MVTSVIMAGQSLIKYDKSTTLFQWGVIDNL